MAYYPTFQQQYPYQDQLSQLRAQPYPMQSQSNGLLWVQGESGAKSYLMAPNTTVLLMDSEAQRFYLKSTDMSGVPSMRVFEYNEVVPNQVRNDQFVTREEFDRFVQSLANKTEVTDNG